MLLKNVNFSGKSIDLAKNRTHEDSNVITILMGGNSSGKSRIFQTICSAFIRAYYGHAENLHNLRYVTNLSDIEQFDSISYLQNSDLTSLCRMTSPYQRNYNLNNSESIYLSSDHPYTEATIKEKNNITDENIISAIKYDFLSEAKLHGESIQFKKNGKPCDKISIPNRILAVTCSPYDKFPLPKPYTAPSLPYSFPYFYLGARQTQRSTHRINSSYLDYKFDQLGASFIKLLLKPKQKHFDFSKILNFLNISNSFTLKMNFNELLNTKEVTLETISNLMDKVNLRQRAFDGSLKRESNNNEVKLKILEAIRNIIPSNSEGNIYPSFLSDILCTINLSNGENDNLRLDSLGFLSEYGLIELEDIIFQKTETNHEFLLSQASSGELSLLFTMASIAGEIQNNSLILIDEPELSLHPRWQLKFISLLSDIFSNYKSCHFIIATHSPNIVSSLPVDDAYIVHLETNEVKLMPSKLYHHRSSDFQLAEVFDSPGNNNEYLISQVIEVLDKLCKSKTLDETMFTKAEWLMTFENKVGDNDRVKILLNILQQTIEALKAK
ncbi:AAA family ATPase [Raoultella ornithinolytica]|uniref:AAA family ATPase n=1 Tax=Raoultella ornithinolytica TaxID=54291 RepID=UPI000F4B64B0|nr:AAA family ATPase [Raoultella ornithinolytica]AYW54133.1 ATP-binding protein [Raoultella ornithinolytica]QYE31826.1 ATP-binding protein [Raoultella ornithinolytica]